MIEITAMAVTVISMLICAYVYVGFPVLMLGLGKLLAPRPLIKADIQPTVALIISCYNEAEVIDQKLRNSLALNYPSDRLQILVVSDGSTDATDEIVTRYSHAGVKLLRVEGRLGKTAGLNRAMEAVDSEIVVFSDANAMYHPDAIRRLVRSFADPSVGYVVGAALYTDATSNGSARSESAYWSLEIRLKMIESGLGFVVGGDGALYGIRQALWQPLAPEDINDFVNPLQIVAKGYRGVFEPEAICYESTAGGFREEARRKRRIVNRSFLGLWKVREVLNPFAYGAFSLALVSHKLLRWLCPIFLLAAVFGSVALALQGNTLFALVTVGIAALGTLALVGRYLEAWGKHVIATALPFYFVIVNWNAMLGVLDALRGRVQVTWRTPRAADAGASGGAALPWAGIAIVLAFWLISAYALVGGTS